jgi:hypothetical protein
MSYKGGDIKAFSAHMPSLFIYKRIFGVKKIVKVYP